MSSSLHFPQRRIITSHSSSSKVSTQKPTVVINDDTVTPTFVPLPQINDETKLSGACLWTTTTSPAINSFSLDLPAADAKDTGGSGLVTKGGSNLRVTVLDPHAEVGMHRTSSIDYNIFTHGSAVHTTPEYDADGKETLKEVLVKAGDVVIQRGTLHAWKATEEGVRWITVLVEAKSAEGPDGEVLEDVNF